MSVLKCHESVMEFHEAIMTKSPWRSRRCRESTTTKVGVIESHQMVRKCHGASQRYHEMSSKCHEESVTEFTEVLFRC